MVAVVLELCNQSEAGRLQYLNPCSEHIERAW